MIDYNIEIKKPVSEIVNEFNKLSKMLKSVKGTTSGKPN